MLGLAHDYLKDGSDIDHYTNVKVLDPNVAIKYFGIHYEPFKMGKGDRPELKTLALCAMWQYFSDISFAEYGLLQPGVCYYDRLFLFTVFNLFSRPKTFSSRIDILS